MVQSRVVLTMSLHPATRDSDGKGHSCRGDERMKEVIRLAPLQLKGLGLDRIAGSVAGSRCLSLLTSSSFDDIS
jgi:hypothetical protein